MSLVIKRCSVAAVLAMAALIPDFRVLHTSQDGLKLIANLEGCRLTPYQCSAGVWTSGIGHTAGVKPTSPEITVRQAAANLVTDVLNVERTLAYCVPTEIPQPVYDALVSFSFNVGTSAACKSTLVSYLRHQQWQQACEQLPRWVYINGIKNKGLENRREQELAHCMKGIR